MSSSGRKTVKDLVEEAKKRVVLLLICVFGLSYLMSLTSSSVWVNLPAAAALIIFGRYISLDLDARKRTMAQDKLSLVDRPSKKKTIELHTFPLEKPNWRRKVNSPAVEAAIEKFTRHLVSEWVTDLWYSRVTPDKDGPEELVQIINSVLGEISVRARDINLINLLTRDIMDLVCNHLELYRLGLSRIKKQDSGKLPIDYLDSQLRLVLAADNKLHPALFSAEAEHKASAALMFLPGLARLSLIVDVCRAHVLQHLMNGLIQITFKPEDLLCSFFRYTVRELLACAVFRPVLNLANPRFINEKIELLVLSLANKADKKVTPPPAEAQIQKPSPKTLADQNFEPEDHSTVGLELVQVRQARASVAAGDQSLKNSNGVSCEKDHTNFGHVKPNTVCNSGGEWAQTLDMISKRKTQVLAPENLESMWTKGRNYKKKEGTIKVAKLVVRAAPVGSCDTSHHSEAAIYSIQDRADKLVVPKSSSASSYNEDQHLADNLHIHTDNSTSTPYEVMPYQDRTENMIHEETETESSYQSEDDESNTVTGLDSPGTRVWDSKNKSNDAVSHIRHPLETSELHLASNVKGLVRHPKTTRTSSRRKRPRSNKLKVPIWQEVERTSFILGEGHDILREARLDSKAEELSIDPEAEIWGRVHSGAAASSSFSSISTSESCMSSMRSPENSVLADSFLKLRCEVLGANIVKSGSGTFAVYSIAVTDANNNGWSIKRRYRHFEDLHRRLKEFPEYNLSLPPKHFLSSGLDVPVVLERCKLLDTYLKDRHFEDLHRRLKEFPEYNLSLPPKHFLSSGLDVPVVLERCKLLDTYLKMLLQFPTISGSIEVWDFLSVDSQTYVFSDSLSIIQTLSVNLDNKSSEKATECQSSFENINGQFLSAGESTLQESKQYCLQMNKNNVESDSFGLRKRNLEQISGKNHGKEKKNSYRDNLGIDSETSLQKNVSSSTNNDTAIKVGVGGADVLQETSPIPETVDDLTFPTEWVPPNLSVPILNLVDVVFQLQDGGWIRRQAFWVAKQLLQLGMGDAFDDWLMEKIQLLRKGTIIASVINRVEQILWPDGIFLTKHPSRKPPTPVTSPSSQMNNNVTDNKVENQLTPEQQLEAARRAKFVYELMIDRAPAALVSLVGRKEYERCAEDVYFFLQSPLCLKQLAFGILELILVSTFPELDDVVRLCHEDKAKFGEFNSNI